MLSAVAHMSQQDAFYHDVAPQPTTPFKVISAPGWHISSSNDWVLHKPSGIDIPIQGWKVHVSASVSEAQRVLDITTAIATRLRVAFKHLPTQERFLWRNSKNCDRRHSGKFIALFPSEEQLPLLLHSLERGLAGRNGPYILSDRRWAEAPVYLRYGLFRPHSVGAQGQPDTQMRDLRGNAVSDDRSLSFCVPEWAPIPEVLKPWLEQTAIASRVDLPFSIERALSHSNAGGVYIGKYSDRPVIIKEARPYAGLDRAWKDAIARLEREQVVLEKLSPLRGVPKVLYSGHHWEHLYLVEEQLPGVPLQDWLHRNEPRQDCESKVSDWWATSCRSVLVALRRLLRQVHESGWAHMDIHPGNVLINPETLGVSLVDFENSVASTSEPCAQSMAALGYALPGLHTPQRHDLYGLSRIAASMLWISRSESVVDPGHVQTVLRLAREDRQHPWLRPGTLTTDMLLDEVEDLFREVLNLKGAPIEPIGPVRSLSTTPSRDWETELEAGLAASTKLHGQTGRIYPAHYRALAEGWTGISSGDAVIARVLGTPLAAFPKLSGRHLGLMNGLVGDLLGLQREFPDKTAEVIREKVNDLLSVEDHSVFGGLPGILMGLSRLQAVMDDPELSSRVTKAIELLAQHYLKDPDYIVVSRKNQGNHPYVQSTGLLYGNLGLAWLFTTSRHLVSQPDVGLLAEACSVALQREFSHYIEAEGRILADQGTRGLSYLSSGTAGFGILLPRIPRECWPKDLNAQLTGLQKACDAPGAMFAGLFNGYAGLQLGYAGFTRLLGDKDGDEQARQRIRRSLERHAVGLASPAGISAAMICGDGWRLSGDVGTGTAGILVALRGLESPELDLLDWILGEQGEP